MMNFWVKIFQIIIIIIIIFIIILILLLLLFRCVTSTHLENQPKMFPKFPELGRKTTNNSQRNSQQTNRYCPSFKIYNMDLEHQYHPCQDNRASSS
jgi:hypothetical protein